MNFSFSLLFLTREFAIAQPLGVNCPGEAKDLQQIYPLTDCVSAHVERKILSLSWPQVII
jgi:hypothetical protein